MKKPALDSPEEEQESLFGYGPNNPEPPEFKDSFSLRNPARDSLHAAREYLEGRVEE